MTRRPKSATPAGVTGMPAGKSRAGSPASKSPAGKGAKPKPKPGHAPKPGRAPAHLPGDPGKAGFTRQVKPVPLPGKSRGR